MRSLPAVQWKTCAPSVSARPVSNCANPARSVAPVTKARFMSCIIDRESSGDLIFAIISAMFPDRIGMFSYATPSGKTSGLLAISGSVRRS